MDGEAFSTIHIEVWLYGPLSKYGGNESQGSHAVLKLRIAEGTRMDDLLRQLGLPAEEKGMTFINGQLTDMPGLAADLEWEFRDGDRIGVFHRQSMWPFQYRDGASMSAALAERLRRRSDQGVSHAPSATSDRERVDQEHAVGGDQEEGEVT